MQTISLTAHRRLVVARGYTSCARHGTALGDAVDKALDRLCRTIRLEQVVR